LYNIKGKLEIDIDKRTLSLKDLDSQIEYKEKLEKIIESYNKEFQEIKEKISNIKKDIISLNKERDAVNSDVADLKDIKK